MYRLYGDIFRSLRKPRAASLELAA